MNDFQKNSSNQRSNLIFKNEFLKKYLKLLDLDALGSLPSSLVVSYNDKREDVRELRSCPDSILFFLKWFFVKRY